MDLSLPFALRVAGWLAALAAGVWVLRVRSALGPAAATALLVATVGMYLGGRIQARLEVLPLLEAVSIGDSAGGGRAPLALLVAGGLAMAWCKWMRLPLAATADALAVAASTLLPFARAACLVNGCCLGDVCGALAIPGLCVRVGITSAVFHRHVEQGLIPTTSALSLPLHPLPLYFAAASLGTLAVLTWQIRRGAAPGRPALVFCILQSLAMLILEPLRAIPRPSVLMTAIPLAVLAVALAATVARTMRDSRAAKPSILGRSARTG